MTGFNATLKTATKLAWRNLKRTKVQSILVISLTIIPFAIATYVSVQSQSGQATPSEKIDYQLGNAKNLVQPQGSPGVDWYQNPDSIDINWMPKGGLGDTALKPRDTGVQTDPFTVINTTDALVLHSLEATWKTRNGVGAILSVEGEYWSPKFGNDKFAKVLSGTTPQADNEAMLSPTALRRFGVNVGDKITRLSDDGFSSGTYVASFKVVGVLQTALYPNQDVVYAPKLFGKESAERGIHLYYFFDGQPLGWHRVLELNKLGLGVLSRSVLQNPPAFLDQPLLTINQPNRTEEELANGVAGGGFWRIAWIAFIAYYALMVLVPIAVIVSASFLFGARRQTHTLALLSSVGATKRTIRAVTMVSAFLLTMVGSLIGMAIGIAAAAIILPLKMSSWHTFAGLHIDWAWLAIFTLLAMVLSFMVGVVPARQSTKINVLSVLRGTNLPTRLRIRTGFASLLMLTLSSAFIIAATIWQRAQYAQKNSIHQDVVQWISVGISLSQIILMLSFVVGSGWIIRGVSAALIGLSRVFKSFTLRFAGRDLILSRRRFSPLVSSMAVVAFIATALITTMNASSMLQVSMSQSQALSNQVFFDANQEVTQYSNTDSGMSLGLGEIKRTSAQIEGMRLELASTSNTIVDSAVLRKTADPWSQSSQADTEPISMAHLDLNQYCGSYSASASVVVDSSGITDFATRECENDPAEATRFVIGDVAGLRLMSGGAVNPEAEKVLTEGGFVAFDSLYSKNGSIAIDRVKRSELFSTTDNSGKFTPPTVISSKTIKSIMNPSIKGHFFAYAGMMNDETAFKLGIPSSASLIVLNTNARVTSDLADRWMQAGFSPTYDQINGISPEDLVFWGNLIVLGLVLLISGLAVGLTQLEARNDQRTLSRLGAPRRFLGVTTAVQMFLLLAVSSGLGAMGGELMSRNIYQGVGGGAAQSPWQYYLLLIVGAPLIASLLALLAAPRKPERRAKVSIE